MGSDVVVELAECFDTDGHLGAVGGQFAPKVFDLDGAVVALDDAVGLWACLVRELGPRVDVAREAVALVAGAVVGDDDHRGDLAGACACDVCQQRVAEQVVRLAAGVLERADRVAGRLCREEVVAPRDRQLPTAP